MVKGQEGLQFPLRVKKSFNCDVLEIGVKGSSFQELVENVS